MAPDPGTRAAVLCLGGLDIDSCRRLLAQHDLSLVMVPADSPIPGSYWGDPEAGVIGSTVYARADTPLHSLLHESCHLIVLPPERRATVHTDATDSEEEEDAVCYLQILMAEQLLDGGGDRLMQDMDTWGYSFRLGSTRAWFEGDAENAASWLRQRGLIDTPALAGENT